MRSVYVNGRYLPAAQAMVSFQDRGFQFADGVYEVVSVYEGTLLDEEGHLKRLLYSLEQLKIRAPFSLKSLQVIMRNVMKRNLIQNGLIYIQVTRGSAPRDHVFPSSAVKPSVIVSAKPVSFSKYEKMAQKGIKVITLPDERWKHCHIKTVSLLPNVLAKQTAKEQGASEAWLYTSEGIITEGSSSNAWLLTADNCLVTTAKGPHILAGITRQAVLDLCQAHGIRFEERPFTRNDIQSAQEAFITSASMFVMPVVCVDDTLIGNGQVGPLSQKLRTLYQHRNAS